MNDEEIQSSEQKVDELGPVPSYNTDTFDTNNNSNTENKSSLSSKDMESLSIVGLILGVASILTVFKPLAAILCGVLAIIFGAVSKKRTSKPYSKAAIICGIVGIVLSLLIVSFLIMLGGYVLSTIANWLSAN